MDLKTESTKGKIDYLSIVIAYCTYVAVSLPGSMLGIAWASDNWPSMQGTFNLSLDAIGVLLTTTTIGYALSSFLTGRLFIRYKSSTLFAIGSTICAAALLGYAALPSWRLIVACGFLVGIGSGLVDAGLNIYFAAVYDARLMNWLHACYGLGTVLGPVLMTVILSNGGTWQTGYLICAGVYAAVATLYVLSRLRWVNIGRKERDTESRGTTLSTLRIPLVIVSLGIFLAYAGLEGVSLQWIFPLLNKARNVDAVTAATWLVLLQASFTLGRVFFGFISVKIKTDQLIRLCAVSVALASLMLIINPIPSYSFIVLAVFGFSLAPIWALTVTSLHQRLGPVHGANAIGFMVSAASLGIGLLPSLSGVVADMFSLEVIPATLFLLAIILFTLHEVTIRLKVDF